MKEAHVQKLIKDLNILYENKKEDIMMKETHVQKLIKNLNKFHDNKEDDIMMNETLNSIFMRISSEKGNQNAKDIMETNFKVAFKYLNAVLEVISITLQAEANRCKSSALGQLNTGKIGKNIKAIIERQIDNLITHLEQDKQQRKQGIDLIRQLLKSLAVVISKDKQILDVVNQVTNLNLYIDFRRVVDKICSFDIKAIDTIFRYLILVNILRRMERRQLLLR